MLTPDISKSLKRQKIESDRNMDVVRMHGLSLKGFRGMAGDDWWEIKAKAVLQW